MALVLPRSKCSFLPQQGDRQLTPSLVSPVQYERHTLPPHFGHTGNFRVKDSGLNSPDESLMAASPLRARAALSVRRFVSAGLGWAALLWLSFGTSSAIVDTLNTGL